MEASHDLVLLFLERQKGQVAAAELFIFYVFIGKALHDTHAQQAVLRLRVDLAQLPAAVAEGFLQLSAENVGGDQQGRKHEENQQRQRHIDRQEDHKGDADLEKSDEELFRAVVGKLGDIKQIAGHAAHDLADLGVVVKRKAQLLQMAEEV